MSKKIVFCADGTWDDVAKETNVYKLFTTLAHTSTQFPYYDKGVGAGQLPLEHLLAGAFGLGLFQKIKDGYTAIAHCYEVGDQIFIFGFSRGAYTARSLAGMISVCGVPTVNFDDNLVHSAFQVYRDTDRTRRAASLACLTERYGLFDAKISLLGVWDTVGALGIPGSLLGDNHDLVFGFLDTDLHPDVLCACHAVSIDERRKEFRPTLWTRGDSTAQAVEQVWFAGTHGDVGGGYKDGGLSDISLSWMLGKAIERGIEVVPSIAAQYINVDPRRAFDPLHETWTALWGVPLHRAIPADATLADSVQRRLSAGIGYRPPNLNR